MTTSKYFDNQVIRIGFIFGLIGGWFMVSLDFTDFGLYYLHGYLFLINYLLTMIVGLAVYKKLAKDESTYLKRLTTGFLIYALTTICFTIDSVIFGTLSNNRTWEDKLFVPLILIAFGLILSSLLALFFKPKTILR